MSPTAEGIALRGDPGIEVDVQNRIRARAFFARSRLLAVLGLVLIRLLSGPTPLEAQQYVFSVPMQISPPGVPARIPFTMDNSLGDEAQGLSASICFDPTILTATAVEEGLATSPLNMGAGADFFQIDLLPNGITVGIVVDFLGMISYPIANDHHILDVVVDVIGSLGEISVIDFCVIGSPPVSNVVVVNGASQNPMLVPGSLEVGFTTSAIYRFSDLGPAVPGEVATGEVLLETGDDVYGFRLGVTYDGTDLTLLAAAPGVDLAAVAVSRTCPLGASRVARERALGFLELAWNAGDARVEDRPTSVRPTRRVVRWRKALAELLLQTRDAPAHRRGREVQGLRRRREAPLARDGDEDEHVVRVGFHRERGTIAETRIDSCRRAAYPGAGGERTPSLMNAAAEQTRTTFRLEVAITTDIAAPPEKVWALLTDAPGFARWNGQVTAIEGTIAKGEKVVIRVPYSERAFPATVLELDPPRGASAGRMVWGDGFAPMFRGERTWEVTPTESGCASPCTRSSAARCSR